MNYYVQLIVVLLSCVGLRILTQPKNVICQPGDKLGFSVKTSRTAKAYQWNFNGIVINKEDKDYDGSSTDVLSVTRCLPKHKGSYQCIVMTELKTSLRTEIATLEIGMYTEVCQTPYITFIILPIIGHQFRGAEKID